jgi:hypothetical protein
VSDEGKRHVHIGVPNPGFIPDPSEAIVTGLQVTPPTSRIVGFIPDPADAVVSQPPAEPATSVTADSADTVVAANLPIDPHVGLTVEDGATFCPACERDFADKQNPTNALRGHIRMKQPK